MHNDKNMLLRNYQEEMKAIWRLPYLKNNLILEKEIIIRT